MDIDLSVAHHGHMDVRFNITKVLICTLGIATRDLLKVATHICPTIVFATIVMHPLLMIASAEARSARMDNTVP